MEVEGGRNKVKAKFQGLTVTQQHTPGDSNQMQLKRLNVGGRERSKKMKFPLVGKQHSVQREMWSQLNRRRKQ